MQYKISYLQYLLHSIIIFSNLTVPCSGRWWLYIAETCSWFLLIDTVVFRLWFCILPHLYVSLKTKGMSRLKKRFQSVAQGSLFLQYWQYLGRGINGAFRQSACVLDNYMVTNSLRENTQKYEVAFKNLVTDFRTSTLRTFPFINGHH
jgi:hypothetical protein